MSALVVGRIKTEKIGPTVRAHLSEAGVYLPPVVECWLIEHHEYQDVTVGMTLVDSDGPFTVTMLTSDLIVDWDES